MLGKTEMEGYKLSFISFFFFALRWNFPKEKRSQQNHLEDVFLLFPKNII